MPTDFESFASGADFTRCGGGMNIGFIGTVGFSANGGFGRIMQLPAIGAAGVDIWPPVIAALFVVRDLVVDNELFGFVTDMIV